jgi:hypothetical protein
MKKPKLAIRIMDQNFFNQILHLVEAHPQQGRRMIGLGSTALWELWQRVSEMVREEGQHRVKDSVRKRQKGGGRKKEAEVLCRLLVTLLYLRQHWTMQALAETIGCAESTVWNYIHEMLPYLRKGLPASLLEQWQQECDSVERAELERWLASLPEGELLVDTWEQPIPRPQDNDKQKAHYSGKQGDHTFKNQLISLPNGTDIVDVVIGEKGPRSDSKLFEETQAELPEVLKFIGDKAYVGRSNTTTPLKKPKGGQLTQEQKDFNRQVSKKRVYVEHLIRVLKIFRIAKEEFRMRSRMYELVIGCICGIVRLRVQYI